MIGEWLVPWQSIDREDERAGLLAELQREIDAAHPLWGLAAMAVARRQDNDDVVFALCDGRMAVVHLTWIGTQDRLPWPATEIYATADAFVRDRLLLDHREWTDANMP